MSQRKLDIVFANAGMAKYATLGKITQKLYDLTFDTNVKGLRFTVQKALPLLPDGASIILNASIVASKGMSSNSVYSATKAAVRSLARTWTTDLKARRLRVNVVSPGSTDTPGLSDLLASGEAGQERLKMISNSVPLGRLGRPDEIEGRGVSRIRRQQQHHGNGIVCGWRLCTSVGRRLRKTPANPADLNTQVFTARFTKHPEQIDVVRLPVFRIAKIPVGEVVGFGNALHDFLCSRDDVSRGEEPQPPDKCVKPDKF